MLPTAFAFTAAVASLGATTVDPAVYQVRALTASLLKSMRAGATESMAERYRDLQPVVAKAFALPLVARLSVGPEWTKFTPGQKEAVVAAFSRFTVANYAHNFRSFDGQKFVVDENVLHRGPEEVVRQHLIPLDESPADLLYLMEDVNGGWKIVDVYYNGISQLALHRADFAGAIGAGGAPLLIAHLNKVSDDLLK